MTMVFALILSLMIGLWPAANGLESVWLKDIKVDGTENTLLLAVWLSAPSKPNVFALDENSDSPKLVIDFMGANMAIIKNEIDSPSPLVREIRTVRHSDKIRILLLLQPGLDYKIEHFLDKNDYSYRMILTTKKKAMRPDHPSDHR